MSADGVIADVNRIMALRQQIDDDVDDVREKASKKLADLEDALHAEYDRARALAVEVDASRVDELRATSRLICRHLDRIANL